MANEVFISYSRRDFDMVKRVKDEIDREVGIDCWMDHDGMESGEQREDVVFDAISRHDTVLFMQTATSMKDEWALKELQTADKQGKYIILVDLDHSAMPDHFDFYYYEKKSVDWSSTFERDRLLRSMKRWFGKIETKDSDISPHRDDLDRYGYSDEFGRIILPCLWHDAYRFVEGLARVEDGGFGFIDKTGHMVVPCEWSYARDFSDGLALVWDEYDCRGGFIDKTGQLVIPHKWKEARDFSEGLAGVKDANGKWGFIDKTGQMVIPCQWKMVNDFSEGLASVEDDNNKWGFIDKTGCVVIPCQWFYAESFRKGMAKVSEDLGKWKFVEKPDALLRRPDR